ncbi:hypothetical protein BCR34DRAFT_658102 [Clohesyomyces aquaticus]|uniref:ABM domain-containing protein n=1 Tax=Clohesyomyces aquaticus TaxID=1231657 RepID=A0A1Y1ZET6_9PLEO|nr:hypothetical protein BCR34DRAFT_658102 [Clohesyomyces aquaticus]
MSNDFYLFANCNFVPDKYEDWQLAYDDLAKYVQSSEPTTKTYYFGIPMDYAHDISKTTSMFAFEIYGSREDLYATHLTSPAMTMFLQKIPLSTTTDLDLAHYGLVAGFLDSSATGAPCAIMQDIRITSPSLFARSALLVSLAKFIGSVQRTELSRGGSDVLTYTGYECLDDDTGARIFGRWRTREAFEAFIRRADVAEFWRGIRGNVARLDQRCYVENGKGWLHRGEGSGYAGES